MRHTECRWVCIHSSSIYSNIFLYIQFDSSVWSVRIHQKGDDDDDAECIALECWLQRRHLLKYYLFVQFYFVFVFRFCSVVVANQKTVCFKYLLGILLRRVYFLCFLLPLICIPHYVRAYTFCGKRSACCSNPPSRTHAQQVVHMRLAVGAKTHASIYR